MIQLTRINRKPLVLNSDLIEHIEVTPDTVISMISGQKFMVLESADQVIQNIIAFRKTICAALPPCTARVSSAICDTGSDDGATEE
jgi:flagellar protein FlbD